MQTQTIRTTSPGGLTITKHPGPAPYLYPGAVGGVAALCWACFQPSPDLAVTSDRRVGGGELVTVCPSCHHALVSGRPVALPSREELPGLLVRWARWDVNGEVDEEFTARMLAALLPGLTGADAVCWFGCLQGALLELQERDEFGFELLSVPPEDRDLDALVADSAAKVDECIAKLIGGAL